MAIVDSQGRLLGKVSLLDLGAALIILLVLFGIFVFPGASGSVAQVGATKQAVEMDVILRVAAPAWRDMLKPGDTTNLVIRNQPSGQVKIKSVEEISDNVYVAQPDGSVKSMPDPRPEASLSKNLLVTLTGDAQITDNGPLVSNNKIKVGTPIELEGFKYSFSNLNVRDIRVLGKK